MADLQTVLSLLNDIVECRDYRGPDAIGATLGELGAAAELHRIIDNDRTMDWWK